MFTRTTRSWLIYDLPVFLLILRIPQWAGFSPVGFSTTSNIVILASSFWARTSPQFNLIEYAFSLLIVSLFAFSAWRLAVFRSTSGTILSIRETLICDSLPFKSCLRNADGFNWLSKKSSGCQTKWCNPMSFPKGFDTLAIKNLQEVGAQRLINTSFVSTRCIATFVWNKKRINSVVINGQISTHVVIKPWKWKCSLKV